MAFMISSDERGRGDSKVRKGGLPPLLNHRSPVFCDSSTLLIRRAYRVRFWIYHRTWSYFLCAFDNDRFARLHSIFDDPHRANTIGHLNGPDFDLVTTAHNSDLIVALQLRDGALRHQQRLVFRTRHRADTSVLPGSQEIAGVWKNSRQPDGAGFLIHLPVREIETSFFRIGAAVRQD